MNERAAKRNLTLLAVVLLAAALCSGCFGFGKKKSAPDADHSVAPDKVLYDRAMNDIQHGRYTIGRLSLQTLINTYPDSEYLAKAKLAIADSYYKEGGTSGLIQSVAEYKDFITFFPFLDEAPYAQMQVAMAHYRLMEKPDRDRTQAALAEQEFQTFLLKFPQSKLVPVAEQRLREVQEVLAEGDYRVARFYYLRGAYGSAASRLVELTNRYPLYSQADNANWMLADIYQRAEHSEIAAKYYARIVRDYPLSRLAGDAKNKLIALGYPLPQPDPNALARMEQEQKFERRRPGLLRRSLGMFHTGPDVSMAAHEGEPDLNPPSESGTDEVLNPNSSLNAGTAGTSSGGATGSSVSVEKIPAGSSTPTPAASSSPAPAASGNPPASGDSSGPSAESGSETSTSAAQSAVDPSKGLPPSNNKKTGSKKDKESSSKKKKGLRKLIPW